MQLCCVTNRLYWCPLSCTGRQSALLAANPVYWSPFTSMGAQTSVWFDIWLYWRPPLCTGCYSLLLAPNLPYWAPLGSIGVQPSVLVCFALLAFNLPYWSPVSSTGVQPSICNNKNSCKRVATIIRSQKSMRSLVTIIWAHMFKIMWFTMTTEFYRVGNRVRRQESLSDQASSLK